LVRAIDKKRKTEAEKKADANKPNEAVQKQDEQEIPSGNISENPVTVVPRTNVLDKFELGILRYVIRYGEQVLYIRENEETGEQIPVKVIDYIVESLTEDEIIFENSLYKQVLDESQHKIGQPDFIAERYFLNHPDPVISQLAVMLASDKYALSKVHSKFQKVEEESERLFELVPYEVLNYKNAILQKQMDEINARIKAAQDNNQPELLESLIIELTKLWQQPKKHIAKHLGERIILKI